MDRVGPPGPLGWQRRVRRLGAGAGVNEGQQVESAGGLVLAQQLGPDAHLIRAHLDGGLRCAVVVRPDEAGRGRVPVQVVEQAELLDDLKVRRPRSVKLPVQAQGLDAVRAAPPVVPGLGLPVAVPLGEAWPPGADAQVPAGIGHRLLPAAGRGKRR